MRRDGGAHEERPTMKDNHPSPSYAGPALLTFIGPIARTREAL